MYFQKARELGELILKSEQSLRLADARDEYAKNPEAQTKMAVYSEYQQTIRDAVSQELLTKEELQDASARLSAMVTDIQQDPVAGALIFAENEFNGLINQVLNVLKHTITGDTGCESNCSSCSGCGN